MSDMKPEAQEESFAELFEKSMEGNSRLEPGQSIETEIVSISGGCIFLQLNGKSEGVLNIEEMTDKEGNLTVKEGDTIQVYFLQSKDGEMRFTTRISGEQAGSEVLRNAYENGIPVEGFVDKERKGGFDVKIGDNRAFCPYSQMGERRVEDASIYVGRNLTFKIIEYGERGRNILVSNRAILAEERKKQVEEMKETLKVDMTVKATVKTLRDFGAFVDIGGLQALLPISEVSRRRINDINEVLTEGQEIEVLVIKLDWANERIAVSMKALQADPWDTARAKYKIDSKHTGKVVRLTDFGAFVSLEEGLDGLIHISDMETDSRDTQPRDLLKKGQSVTVKINSVDTERKRISLRPLSSTEEDENYQKYMEPETDTYNPFAALLKDKMKK